MAILTDRRQPAISTYDPVARVPAVPPDDATPIEPSRGGSGSVQFDFSVTGAVTRLATAGRAPPRRQPKNALHCINMNDLTARVLAGYRRKRL